jgi:trimeric autotransporter adhesin
MIDRYIPFKALVVALTLSGASGVQGQLAFTGSYQQDFDVLGSDTSWLEGWNGVNAASSPGTPLTLGLSTGSSTGGGLYNVGSSGSPDRALGSLATGTVVPRFGVQFQNTSGETFTDIQLGGLMEQWRSGGSAAVNEVLTFEYSFDAQGIDDSAATWHLLGGMDLWERLTETTSSGAVDGNLAENQSLLGGTISDAMWLDQGMLTLRWTDFNDTGNDGMYALDNFSMSGITAVPEPSVYALVGLGLLALLSRPARR